jgi:hypothetical protein
VRIFHHSGDLSYARGAAHIWDEWLHMIQSFAACVPLLIDVGNHEYDHTSRYRKDPSGLNASQGFMPTSSITPNCTCLILLLSWRKRPEGVDSVSIVHNDGDEQ